MPTTDLEENKIKQAQPEEGNDTAQNEREIRKNIFKNERVNFILGVILVIFSLYLTISFISFFFTGSIDQSKVENLSVGELSSIGNEIQNWTGAFGAYLSNLMINRWMGISAFIVSLWLYVVGRRFMKVAHTRMIRFTISCALSIIVLSLFFGFIFMHSYNNTFLYLGGYHGYYATLWLNAWIGPWGTALFIIALVIILLVHLSYKTIEYIRRVSSVNLTGKAIQAIKNRTDNPETDNENDNRETESNEIQNTENIPSSENDIVNTLPEYPDDPTEEIPTLEDIQENILPMHCSANMDPDTGETAIFFGLSGTGKTTLSTDPKRLLIGDDEHGWDDNGVFNFEGGCYAKVINLDKESEPDIYNAIKRDALLENVTLDKDGKIDFDDKSVTENTRVSYPIDHIKNIVRPISSAPAAKNVIFLSADAFGVLPPVSILSPEQTQYYFLSGFTAKLAGTERGITEPTPTFSACFGQAFLELHPTKYAEELVKKMEKSGAKAYLVNTGWNGTGKRISIKDTRGIIDAILNGDINNAPTKTIPVFNFEVPTELNGVDTGILDPRDTYADASEWEKKADDLAERFIKNFAKYEGNDAGKALVSAGPQK